MVEHISCLHNSCNKRTKKGVDHRDKILVEVVNKTPYNQSDGQTDMVKSKRLLMLIENT